MPTSYLSHMPTCLNKYQRQQLRLVILSGLEDFCSIKHIVLNGQAGRALMQRLYMLDAWRISQAQFLQFVCGFFIFCNWRRKHFDLSPFLRLSGSRNESGSTRAETSAGTRTNSTAKSTKKANTTEKSGPQHGCMCALDGCAQDVNMHYLDALSYAHADRCGQHQGQHSAALPCRPCHRFCASLMHPTTPRP